MMGHREKLKGGAEYDFLTRWRRFLAANAGIRSKIKSGFNRRVRKEARKEIANDQT